jgi:hypothetical protein
MEKCGGLFHDFIASFTIKSMEVHTRGPHNRPIVEFAETTCDDDFYDDFPAAKSSREYRAKVSYAGVMLAVSQKELICRVTNNGNISKSMLSAYLGYPDRKKADKILLLKKKKYQFSDTPVGQYRLDDIALDKLVARTCARQANFRPFKCSE